MSKVITASAPGKINLIFEVGQLEANGYHPVNSLYLAVDLREVLSLVSGEPGTGISIYVHGDSLPERHIAAVPTDESNLIAKAAVLFAKRFSTATPDLQVDLLKSIPVAGGMAGGSADAAAMLVAMNEFMNQEFATPKLSLTELAQLGAELGSDVPFCIYGGMALGTGRGEKIDELPVFGFETHWLLCISNQGLSTPQVYQAFDSMAKERTFRDLSALKIDTGEDLAMVMENDLEEASELLMPALSQLKAKIQGLGALKAMVSGSGPTIAALFSSKEAADKAAEALNAEGLFTLTAKGSEPGARLEG